MKHRIVVPALLCLALPLALVACGGSDTSSSSGADAKKQACAATTEIKKQLDAAGKIDPTAPDGLAKVKAALSEVGNGMKKIGAAAPKLDGATKTAFADGATSFGKQLFGVAFALQGINGANAKAQVSKALDNLKTSFTSAFQSAGC